MAESGKLDRIRSAVTDHKTFNKTKRGWILSRGTYMGDYDWGYGRIYTVFCDPPQTAMWLQPPQLLYVYDIDIGKWFGAKDERLSEYVGHSKPYADVQWIDQQHLEIVRARGGYAGYCAERMI